MSRLQQVDARGSWTSVTHTLLPRDGGALDDFKHLSAIDELTDYEISSSTCGPPQKLDKKSKKKKKNKAAAAAADEHSHQKLSQKKHPKQKEKKKLRGKATGDSLMTKDGNRNKMSCEWAPLGTPPQVIRALSEAGFTHPTPIQRLCLEPAIKQHRDIVAAAETGSGKTLAFGIPILHQILHCASSRGSDDGGCGSGSSDGGSPSNDGGGGSDDNGGGSGDGGDGVVGGRLHALILTPTRELASQVCAHMRAAASHTNITVAVVTGGVSREKQERVMRREPHIVVATPGRLWEMIEKGNQHLTKCPGISTLVIDEADRMVEKGHFSELINILHYMNTHMPRHTTRQTFVSSATLSLVHKVPHKHLVKKHGKQPTSKDKLASIMEDLCMKPNAAIIDLTNKHRVAETLVEARILCEHEEKDTYLHYLLSLHRGRTLVFTNTKDCVRRLVGIFSLLHARPMPLHSDMQQRQRLRNLERFTGEADSILIATDVAARGLDIPDVQHVIHYQLPQTAESYVHRSGRTARANKSGVTVILLSSEEVSSYRKLCGTLEKDVDMPDFPIDADVRDVCEERVRLAVEIDELEHRERKKKSQREWMRHHADVAEIEIEEEIGAADDDEEEEKGRLKKRVKLLRSRLKRLEKGKKVVDGGSLRYPTCSGGLVLPRVIDIDTKVDAITSLTAQQQQQEEETKRKRKRKFVKSLKINKRQKLPSL